MQEPIDQVIKQIRDNFKSILVSDKEYFNDIYEKNLTEEEKNIVGALSALSGMTPTDFIANVDSLDEINSIREKLYKILIKDFLYKVNYTYKQKP